MSNSIVYVSQTGNTALLADRIKEIVTPQGCLFFGPPSPEASRADRIFVGFWTDKGDCSREITDFLNTLEGKEVFLFGTAGFGKDPAYYSRILAKVSGHLGPSNVLIGTFMCQGKMPPSVRARYEAMSAGQPERFLPMLENFDQALSHPDEDDLAGLEAAVRSALELTE